MILRALVAFSISLVFSLLEGRYPYLLTIAGIAPALALIWAIFLALRLGPSWGTVLGFAIGLLSDIWGDHNLGSHSLAFSVIGFLTGSLRDRFYIHSILSIALAVLLISPAGFLVDVLYRLIFVPGFNLTLWGVFTLILRSLFNALITLGLYPLLTPVLNYITGDRK